MKNMELMEERGQYCLRCKIPRKCYDFVIENGISNPDYSMIRDCWYGHFWGFMK